MIRQITFAQPHGIEVGATITYPPGLERTWFQRLRDWINRRQVPKPNVYEVTSIPNSRTLLVRKIK